MKLTNQERETVILYNEEEQTASVYTHSKALCRKLKTLAQERPEECRLERTGHEGQAAEYIVPKAWVKVNPGRRISDAQREALAKARAKNPFCASEKL
ncbi:MAG: immunoglobulin [Clostridiales bacterium]|nr:immunoglobulin [Clostridiales bacterium]